MTAPRLQQCEDPNQPPLPPQLKGPDRLRPTMLGASPLRVGTVWIGGVLALSFKWLATPVNRGSDLRERAGLGRVLIPLPLTGNIHHLHTCAHKPSRLLLPLPLGHSRRPQPQGCTHRLSIAQGVRVAMDPTGHVVVLFTAETLAGLRTAATHNPPRDTGRNHHCPEKIHFPWERGSDLPRITQLLSKEGKTRL